MVLTKWLKRLNYKLPTTNTSPRRLILQALLTKYTVGRAAMRVYNGVRTHKGCHCLPCPAVPRMSSVCKNLLKHENACLSFCTNKSSCTKKKKKKFIRILYLNWFSLVTKNKCEVKNIPRFFLQTRSLEKSCLYFARNGLYTNDKGVGVGGGQLCISRSLWTVFGIQWNTKSLSTSLKRQY